MMSSPSQTRGSVVASVTARRAGRDPTVQAPAGRRACISAPLESGPVRFHSWRRGAQADAAGARPVLPGGGAHPIVFTRGADLFVRDDGAERSLGIYGTNP